MPMENKTSKKHMLALITAIVLITATGCYSWWNYRRHQLYARYPYEIASVLRLAGNNCSELVKALNHYEKSTADSLKLRAAEYLIADMPGKYSEYYDAPWNDVAAVYLRWTGSSNKRQVLDTYQLGKPVRKDDITHITAEYLINNIELAFKAWQEQPWGINIPFDVFCEEILPYRVSTEPLENWRENVFASFADLYTSLRMDTAITVVEADRLVNSKLPQFRIDKGFPPMSFSQLMSSTRGLDDHKEILAVFIKRGLGIPVTFDYTPLLPRFYMGHSLNNLNESVGLHHSFLETKSIPGTAHIKPVS